MYVYIYICKYTNVYPYVLYMYIICMDIMYMICSDNIMVILDNTGTMIYFAKKTTHFFSV